MTKQENITKGTTAQPAAGNKPGGKRKKGRDVKRVISDALKIILPIGISVWMVMWLFGKVDMAGMRRIISGECNFWFVALMMLISIVSHVVRGIRWGIQLRGAGLPRVSVMVESVSIFGAYALNLLFPLLGETWRCVWMAREEDARVSTVVGTDLGDRFSDAVVIVLLFLLSLWVAHDQMIAFLNHYRLGQRLVELLSNPWLWVSLGVLIVAFVCYCLICRRSRMVMRIRNVVSELWRSFAVMFHMKGVPAYLLLTIAIWGCYYLETYVCFYAFPFTRELISQPGSFYGLIPGLVAFVFGSISIAIPSNGGLGPWNIAVAYSLSLFGVALTDGAAYSMVVWSMRSAMLVALGLFAAAYVIIMRHRHSKHHIMPEKE